MVEHWRTSLASGELFLHEARILRADGEYRWMLHHKIAARDANGQIARWFGSCLDIDDRRRVEGELRETTDELQKSQFCLNEGQRLVTWAVGPSALPDSTTGLLNYFESTDSIRPARLRPSRNT